MAAGFRKVKVPQTFPADKMRDAPAHLKLAYSQLGLKEYVQSKGKKVSNPAVEDMFKATIGHTMNAMTTPWCAVGVGFWLERTNTTSTKRANARSYLNWGEPVEPEDAELGDVVVMWRGKCDDGVTGHVALFLELVPGGMKLLGANQGDMISIELFDIGKVLAVRRARHWSQSRTVRSAIGSAVTEAGSQAVNLVPDVPMPKGTADRVLDAMQQAQGPLQQLTQYKPWICGILSAISVGLILYAAYCRVSDHQGGKNT